MTGPDIVTFGCRLNIYESEVIRDRARAAGLEKAVIINTCAVTAEAQRQARQAIRRAKRDDPARPVIVTGCAAQTDPASFAAMPEVDRVLGNAEKREARHYVPDFGLATAPRVRVNDISELRETAAHMLDGFAENTRAFVEIQNGCDHRCTFCIIPFARGPSRSVPAGAIADQLRKLAAQGFAEAVLTGVDITAWGQDLPGSSRLGSLVRRLLKAVPELKRLRLSSIDSVEADEDLFAAFAEEERLMPHLHLSLQSGDDLILKRMKRRHTATDARRIVSRLRALRPDIVFGADLIAGFPTETDEAFANSLACLDELGLTHVHVFPYSPRPGTPAARMPALPGPVIAERAARLRAAAVRRLKDFLAGETGAMRHVLIERDGNGRSEHYAPVRFAAPQQQGAIIRTRIIAAHDSHLEGLPVS